MRRTDYKLYRQPKNKLEINSELLDRMVVMVMDLESMVHQCITEIYQIIE